MGSEFNTVPVREKYQDFDGQNKVQMPLLLADGRYPMTTAELFEQRLQGRGIDRYVDTGDLLAHDGYKGDNQEIKFILTANRKGITETGKLALGLINTKSEYINGAVDLTRAIYMPSAPEQKNLGNAFSDSDVFVSGKVLTDAYHALQGSGVIAVKRKDLGVLEIHMSSKDVLDHKAWRILMKHPDEVPEEFAEDFEMAREYVNKIVFTRYNQAMGVYLVSGEEVPTLRAACVFVLEGRSLLGGGYRLDVGNGRLVGVAPEALNASGKAIVKPSLETALAVVNETLSKSGLRLTK